MNDPIARQEVVCHELGHALGLQHIANSCLRSRITSDLRWYPNAHDYAQLETSYHAGSGESAARSPVGHATHEDAAAGEPPQESHVLSVRDAGNGEKEVTFIRRVYEQPETRWRSTSAAGTVAYSAPAAYADGFDAVGAGSLSRTATSTPIRRPRLLHPLP
jgi:hypothetical protein